MTSTEHQPSCQMPLSCSSLCKILYVAADMQHKCLATLLAGRGLTAPNSNSSICCQSGTLYLRQTTHPHTHVGTSGSTSAPLTGTWVCQTDRWCDEVKSRVRSQCSRTVRSTVLLPTSACQGFSSHTRKTAVSYSPQAQSTNPRHVHAISRHKARGNSA